MQSILRIKQNALHNGLFSPEPLYSLMNFTVPVSLLTISWGVGRHGGDSEGDLGLGIAPQ